MVLYPISHSHQDSAAGRLSAWDAIEGKQRQLSEDWWLVAQPDHAVLSGALARQIHSPYVPGLDEDMLQAIALHDEGWAAFDSSVHRHDGRPMSFLEAPVPDFLQAWRASIERAERDSAVGGIMVSEHFCRIARVRPKPAPGTASNQALIDKFVEEEAGRQSRLLHEQAHSRQDISVLVDVLQFCDLLSLYLCCGSRASIEFPQRFKGHAVGLCREDQLCRMQPAIFANGASLSVLARRYSDLRQSQNIPVLLG